MERKRMNLASKVCPNCKHIFSEEDLVPPVVTFQRMFGYQDLNFYGGNVNRFSNIVCKCGQPYILYWKYGGKGFRLIDIEPNGELVEEEVEDTNTTEEPPKETPKEEKKELPLLTQEQFDKLKQSDMVRYLKEKCGYADINDKTVKTEASKMFAEYLEDIK